jgi:hypothetical protein
MTLQPKPSPAGSVSTRGSTVYPLPTNGMAVAMTVICSTFAESGKLAI